MLSFAGFILLKMLILVVAVDLLPGAFFDNQSIFYF